ncbi:MAG TPA: hypothetical protein VIF14_08170 [Alphaproteobacteria bacterium]|jgi:hypothetical protein
MNSRSSDGSSAGRGLRRMPTGALILTLGLFAASLAHAQVNEGRCENPAPPFTLTEGNRLRGAELVALLSGKAMTYFRKSKVNRGQNRYLKLHRQFRPDGSSLFTCEMGPSLNGPWRPCRRIATARSSVEGNREIGVWETREESVCFKFVSLGSGTPLCFAIHREAGRFYAKVTRSVGNCVEGDFAIDPQPAR